MKKHIYVLILTALMITALMSGCSLFSTNDEIAAELALKAEAVQTLAAGTHGSPEFIYPGQLGRP